MNETEILAKNFEDFIFRKMIEAVYDIDKDELNADYKKEGFEGYRADILYVQILNDIYNREAVSKGLIAYSLICHDEFCQLIQNELHFKELNVVFEHELS